jgi:N6-adenosine-specific RNA methylase IME4
LFIASVRSHESRGSLEQSRKPDSPLVIAEQECPEMKSYDIYVTEGEKEGRSGCTEVSGLLW